MLRRTLTMAAGAGCRRRCFHASRVLDPELRRQLPDRPARDEFSVIRCLARTAGADPDSVPHYAIDDSLFLRYRQPALALARRSGRNTARQFLEKNAPELALLNNESPPVPAWRPLRPLDQLDCSEASLRLLVGLERVGQSWQMYHKLLSDGTAVGDDTRQILLELLAYHAGAEPPLRDISPEEIYFAERPLATRVSVVRSSGGNNTAWAAADNPAQVLYASIQKPTLSAKAAMLKAHYRHGALKECLALYAQVFADPGLDDESHRCALLATGAHTHSWAKALALFRQLPRIDAAAYRCLLKALGDAKDPGLADNQGRRAELACGILAEMAQRGLGRSLGDCSAALSAVYGPQLHAAQLDRLQGPTEWFSNPGQPDACVGLLPSLLDALAADPPDPLAANTPDDLAFFPAAAYLACRVYRSRALAEQLDALLHSGAFLSTLATFQERRIVYEYHLLTLLNDYSAPLDACLRYYADRMLPSGTALHSHLVRLMRRCVAKQAVDRLPALMLHALVFVDYSAPSVLRPGMAFFRCAEIVAQMFADGHPATRDPDFLADLRRCLVGFADGLNNEFVYGGRRSGQSDREAPNELKTSLNAENCATILRLATRLPGAAGAEREFTLQLAALLADCLADQRTSSLDYMLALLELTAALRDGPRYEHRSICQAITDLMDRAAHEYQAKRSDKSDVQRLGRLAELAESARAYLVAGDHRLTETQAAGHLQLARGAAELCKRGGDAATAAARAAAAAEDDSAWSAVDLPEEDADGSADSASDSDDDEKGGKKR